MVGYSGTPLLKKLGLAESNAVYLINAPQEYFDWISPLPTSVTFKIRPAKKSIHFAHIFVTSQKEFETAFLKAKPLLVETGMLWVSWPKKASKINTDLDKNIIRHFGLKNGLVGVKVCAVSEVWSGLKFVYRIKDQKSK
jgi:hypothetical protein